MGALHQGHLSLVERAKREAGSTFVSIFVNPTQFGPNEDFHRYPRPIGEDLERCRRAGVDVVFVPSVDEIYPSGAPAAHVDVPALTNVLDGLHRPGHFAGVCQVVAKLFNIVQPTAACFGEKDFQQLAVLSAMVRALDFPLRIVPCPTIREADGLAMSSRNRYLTPEQRERGLAISRGLFAVQEALQDGERSVATLTAQLHKIVLDAGNQPQVPVGLDYATIVDAVTLAPIGSIEAGRPARALVAMRVGTTRLIDNVALEV